MPGDYNSGNPRPRNNSDPQDTGLARSNSLPGVDGGPTSTGTDGWLELFLTPHEKATFAVWKENVADRSLTHRATKGSFDRLVKLVPPNVSPNLLSLVGLCCLGQAWYVTHHYGLYLPMSCTWFALGNVLVMFVTNSLDSMHAEKIRQRTALVELFKYSCDCCTTVFLAIVTTYLLGGTDVETQWYAVQASQLLLFLKHLSAFHRNDGLRYNVLTGPGEVLILIMCLLCVRATLGLDWFVSLYEKSLHKFVAVLDGRNIAIPDKRMEKIADPAAMGSELIMTVYYLMYVTAVLRTLMLRKPHGWSRFGLSASLLARFVPAVLLRLSASRVELSVLDVICDGLFMAVLTSDVTLAKMAGREIHPWVVVMSAAAVLSHPVVLSAVIVYYIAVFGDLCHYLNMPLLAVCRNVYCDGVYDLCHIGHKTLFRNALAYGNRLFVGVINDEDCSVYKRPPIMTHAERCAEVQGCKAVTKAIPNAPCFGITREFLEEHQIHVVAFGEEYAERYPDPNDDPYYKVPRLMGIATPQPRTKCLSTSQLIYRVQNTCPADEKKSPT